MANKQKKHLKAAFYLTAVGVYFVPNLVFAQNVPYQYNSYSNEPGPAIHTQQYAYNAAPPPGYNQRYNKPPYYQGNVSNQAVQPAPTNGYPDGYANSNPNLYQAGLNWSGSYLGVMGDVGDGNSRLVAKGHVKKLDKTDFALGLFGGVNFQNASLVYGLEGGVMLPLFKHTQDGVTLKRKIAGDLKARVGLAFGSLLPYGFVGLASNYTTVKDHSNDGVNIGKMHFKYVYGAGLDYKFTPNNFAKVECIAQHNNTDEDKLGSKIINYKHNAYSIRLGLAHRF